jgi:hypothetical protein
VRAERRRVGVELVEEELVGVLARPVEHVDLGARFLLDLGEELVEGGDELVGPPLVRDEPGEDADLVHG